LIEPYYSMTGIELGKYIKSGGIIQKEWSIRQPIICFLGDTTTQVFTRHPELLQQHAIIAMECTYYYGTIHDEQNNCHQHTYWDVLRTNIIQHHPNILFLLQHFSKRHRRYEWKQWFYEYNHTSQHHNVHPMIPTLLQPFDKQIDSSVDINENSCNCFLCQQQQDTGSSDTKPIPTLVNK
jgi:calcineurin-like phosphoesterase family protein